MTLEQIRAIVTYIRSWEPDAPDRPDWRTPGGAAPAGGHDESTGTTLADGHDG